MKSPRLLHASLLLLGAVSIAIAACTPPDESAWYGSHAAARGLAEDRPECPVKWTGSTIPLWRDSIRAHAAAGRGAVATTFAIPSSGLAVPGPITDIPEFHDCQKFIRDGHAAYDSLFAIFAAYNGSDIMTALKFGDVTWKTSNATKATVSATGVVTAVATGSAVITATSTADTTHKVSATVNVIGGPSEGTLGAFGVTKVNLIGPKLHVGDSVALVPAVGPTTSTTGAVAEIYTYGPGYKPLGIGPNFNCLFIYVDQNGQLAAKMVAVNGLGSSVNACQSSINPNTSSGSPEQVLNLKLSPEPKKGDFPQTARWDFDPRSRQYYIGIKCGSFWCEVGSNTFTSSSAIAVGAGADAGEARVVSGKGWYDQQELAVPDGSGNPVPSGIVATVIPHPGLGGWLTKGDFKHFRETGYVALDVSAAIPNAAAYYKTKFNFDPVQPGLPLRKLNRISLCYGTISTCNVPPPPPGKGTCAPDVGAPYLYMWVKIDPANGGPPMYRCGTRRDHTGSPGAAFMVPTARWRWLASDETIWEYCAAAGCCETAGDQTSGGWT